ncbi:MAG: hypothetical protein CVU87_00960 [Firmicutes bacterium HGW-Firmicutes-12]|nr:MAG: hypothetical protein CVU87_00960 [Firmicutes bacterium HGW-Firmicutes-12]
MSEKKLYRSTSGKKIAGVCSGIILYLLCWLIIPQQSY